ncbi:type IV pilin [Methanococcoides methylutens]|uniref:type IV pilin n=1 Tax=Methanococcoides methylutens TaxID=2226 RepID=UPI0006945428|nr:type IV pilin N-terminal domain-containing protein [Methanococcoides methylutens]
MDGSRSFSREDKGVSPVIGVMLMIVVTVILAAAVSSFSGSISQKDTIPQATFRISASYSEQSITIEHLGGDPIIEDFVKFEITSGRPKMSNYVERENVTFYSSSSSAFAPSVLGPGNVAKISFETEDTDKHADIARQWIYIGTPFQVSIVDRETDQAIYSTQIVMQP